MRAKHLGAVVAIALVLLAFVPLMMGWGPRYYGIPVASFVLAFAGVLLGILVGQANKARGSDV